MPLKESGAVLGAAVAAASNPGPEAIAAWVGASVPLVAFLVKNAVLVPGAMVASGTSVSGLGKFTLTGDVDALGEAMSLGAGAGVAGVPQWTAMAQAVVSFFKTNAQTTGAGFTAVAAGGPIGGTSTLQFATLTLGPLLRDAAGATDAASIPAYAAIASAILTHLITVTIVVPATATTPPVPMASPSGGGALTLVGSIK